MSERVNVCVIVGNGFDLAAGLGTFTQAFVRGFAAVHHGKDTPAGRIAERILIDGPENWADFEKKLGEYASVVDMMETVEDPVSEYVDAKAAIESDLNAFIAEKGSFVDNDLVEQAAGECLSSLCGWLDELAPRERISVLGDFSAPLTFDFHFVTLNYTQVLDTMIELQGSSSASAYTSESVSGYYLHECVHAHGDLAGNSICGVDSPSQICSETLSHSDEVLETVVKGQSQVLLGSLDDERAFSFIKSAEVILIYGCSLGETDARWWKAVINWLSASSSKRFIVLYSYGFRRNGRPVAAVRKDITALKERLFSSAGLSDHEFKKALFNRIFILPSESVFKIPGVLISEESNYERN